MLMVIFANLVSVRSACGDDRDAGRADAISRSPINMVGVYATPKELELVVRLSASHNPASIRRAPRTTSTIPHEARGEAEDVLLLASLA